MAVRSYGPDLGVCVWVCVCVCVHCDSDVHISVYSVRHTALLIKDQER